MLEYCAYALIEDMAMRKKIGIFVGDTHNEYPQMIIETVYAEAAKRNYDVFVFGIYGSYGDNLLYAEGERHMLHLPDLSKLDGIIACEDTFDIDNIEDELETLLREGAKCPVVYLRREKAGFYNVLIHGREPMAEMVRHFVVKHGFRDICFMQGPMQYTDSIERYEGFQTVCQEFDIPITEHMVYEGNFWRDRGREAVDWFMEGRDTYPQAIICSNDYMAISVCDELKKRGLRIPEDICVSGYDDTLEARNYYPSISSVGVDFKLLAVKAVEIIDNVNNGREQALVEYISPEVRYHRSCGCGEQVYVTDWPAMLAKLAKQDRNIKQIVFMTTECQAAYEEEEYLRVAAQFFSDTNAQTGYLCLCTEEQSEDTDQLRTEYSNQMVLKRIFTDTWKVTVCDEVFDRTDILPEKYLDTENAGGYMLLGIHHQNRSYGYFVLVYDKEHWADGYAQPYLMCLANVMEDAEVHKQMTDLETIRDLYRRDPLTGIYNRRGFDRELHILYDEMERTKEYVSIVSIDMDYLKYINDNFGHAEGDFALCMLANVLQGMLTEREACARIGGDEYAVLLVSDNRERHEKFGEQFLEALDQALAASGKPYPVGASYGICCINDYPEKSLMQCVQDADAKMYELKKKRKSGRV